MNTQYQDPFSFITKMQERLDGGVSVTLDKALDAIKRGKPEEATALLITLPKLDLALGCVVEGKDRGELVPDERWIPEFIKAALAKAKKPVAVEEKKK